MFKALNTGGAGFRRLLHPHYTESHLGSDGGRGHLADHSALAGGFWAQGFRPLEGPGVDLLMMNRILVATSNAGKLRDFAGAATPLGVEVASITHFASLPAVIEDGKTFEENARKKAEAYSRAVPGEIVLADDSGLEVDALGGAPGVHSARYAADEPHLAGENTDDAANNDRLLRELDGTPFDKRTARFVCVVAAARDGQVLEVFRGEAEGVILDCPRGTNGFGYDPLFYFPGIHKAFAELTAEEKAQYSHRGAAFRRFLTWYQANELSLHPRK